MIKKLDRLINNKTSNRAIKHPCFPSYSLYTSEPLIRRTPTTYNFTFNHPNQCYDNQLLYILYLAQKKNGVREWSLSVILKVFLTFETLSLGDAYKKDPDKNKVCIIFYLGLLLGYSKLISGLA